MTEDVSANTTLFRAMLAEDPPLDFNYYLPQIFEANYGFGIFCNLPDKLYGKWIARVMGNQKFIDQVTSAITPVLEPFLKLRQNYLMLTWNRTGMIFSCEGNACNIGVSRFGGHYEYVPHNVDGSLQALILFTALGIYLPRLYDQFNLLESGQAELAAWPELSDKSFARSLCIRPSQD